MKTAGSSAGSQFACIRARDEKCGKKQPTHEKRQVRTPGYYTPTASYGYTPTSTPGYYTPTSSPTSEPDPGPSGGAIAGIVIGVIGGIGALAAGAWFYWRRRKRNNPPGAAATTTSVGYAEKHVIDPSKPSELPGQNTFGVQQPAAAYTPHHFGEVQQHSGYGTPAELPPATYGAYSQQAHNPYPSTKYAHQPTSEVSELHTTASPRSEMDGSVSQFSTQTPISPPQHPQQQSPPPQQPFQTGPPLGAHELYPRPPEPSMQPIDQQLSEEAIAALREEERRIDAELEEVKRMKELRDKKIEIQQKLKGAGGSS